MIIPQCRVGRASHRQSEVRFIVTSQKQASASLVIHPQVHSLPGKELTQLKAINIEDQSDLEPLAEVERALLVVQVLHAPHPKLLGLLLRLGEHFCKKHKDSSDAVVDEPINAGEIRRFHKGRQEGFVCQIRN